MRNISAKNDDANGQGSREHEANGPPEERPENRSHQNGERGNPRAGAIQHGLDGLGNRKLTADEQGQGYQGYAPAVKESQREGEGHGRAKRRTEIGQKAQDAYDHAPKHGSRNADEVQADADDRAVYGIHGELR